MKANLVTGLRGEKEITVTFEVTAAKYGSGGVEVLATPAMIALMEGAAFETVQSQLPEGYSSVGTRVDIEHLAATPLGMKVKAVAELQQVEGKKLIFSVEARDEKELVGRGTHERYIIQSDKFLARVESKTRD